MSTTPTRARAFRMLATLTAGALAVGGFTALDTSSAPPSAALGSLGELTTDDNPYGVGVSPNGDVALIANSSMSNMDGTVTFIEITDVFTVAETVAIGGEPIDVTFTPDGTQAWVTAWAPDRIAIIDVATRQEVDSIDLPSGPFTVTFSTDGATAWVTDYFDAQVLVVDVASATVLRSVSTGFSGPERSVLSADGSTLYITGTSDAFAAMSTADETFTIYPVPGFLTDVELTLDESEAWLTDNASSEVVIVDAADGTVIERLPTGEFPVSVTRSTSGTQMIVTTEDDTRVYDIASRELIATLPVAGEGELEAVPGMTRYLRASGVDNSVHVLGFDQERLSGADRFSTAVEISQRAFPTGATTVFVASGRTFPDALAAGPAAGTLGGALLLTEPGSLPTVVRDEIARLNPDTIYLVGGTGAVSTAVENALKVLQPNTIRLSGANRYATGAAIIDEVWGGTTVPEVFIATGRNYPDALSAGAVAAGEGIPVILVDGALGSVPQATIDLITELGPTQITIAGGTGAVSAGIASQLDAAFTAEVRRLSGANRYATSAAINLDAYPTNTGVVYATGTGFADALAGAALAGRAQIPVYLVQPGCVPAAALDAIWSGATTNLFLLGGTGALSTAVENLTPCP
ncbi:MAG: cell wall-binding repeat-containing protein [Microcella sp.]